MSDLLPPNSTATERALAEAMAILDEIPLPIREVWNADTIPARYLAWLAWAYSVDEWDRTWEEDQKRATVRASLEIQRHKGTIGAVRNALGALGIYVEVREWYQQAPAGAPFTFTLYIEASQTPVTLEGVRSVEGVVNTTKNLRSHLAEINLRTRSSTRTHVAGTACVGQQLTLTNYVTTANRELMELEQKLDGLVTTRLAEALGGWA